MSGIGSTPDLIYALPANRPRMLNHGPARVQRLTFNGLRLGRCERTNGHVAITIQVRSPGHAEPWSGQLGAALYLFSSCFLFLHLVRMGMILLGYGLAESGWLVGWLGIPLSGLGLVSFRYTTTCL